MFERHAAHGNDDVIVRLPNFGSPVSACHGWHHQQSKTQTTETEATQIAVNAVETPKTSVLADVVVVGTKWAWRTKERFGAMMEMHAKKKADALQFVTRRSTTEEPISSADNNLRRLKFGMKNVTNKKSSKEKTKSISLHKIKY